MIQLNHYEYMMVDINHYRISCLLPLCSKVKLKKWRDVFVATWTTDPQRSVGDGSMEAETRQSEFGFSCLQSSPDSYASVVFIYWRGAACLQLGEVRGEAT